MSLMEKLKERYVAGTLEGDFEEQDLQELKLGKNSRFWRMMELASKYVIIHSEVEMDGGITLYSYQGHEIMGESMFEVDFMESTKIGEELEIILKDNLDENGLIKGMKEISGFEYIKYEYEFNIDEIELVALIEMEEGKPIEFSATMYDTKA